MEKKILIGSIIAVILLTLVSFSSVVGYSSVKSDSKIASPLFSIRNKKGDISSNYLGKGKAINLLLPKRDSEAELFDEFIDNINAMDDRTFDIFVKRFIAYINLNNLDNVRFSNEEIENVLYQMKGNPDITKNIDKESTITNTYYNYYIPTSDGYCRLTTDGNFCFILGLIFIILLLILIIASSFISIFLGIMMTIE